jgi:uncharacterized tellurite resistance protein B-like protein
MAENSEKPAIENDAVWQIGANVEKIKAWMAEGKTEDAEALEAATKALITTVNKPDGKADRVARNKFNAALREAMETKPAEVEKAAKPAAPAEASYKDDPKLVELANSSIEAMLLGIKGALKANQAAKEAAMVDLAARMLVMDKNGVPDLNGQSGQIKELNADVKRAAGAQLDGTDEEVRDAVAAFWRGKQYQMNHVVVDAVRTLADTEENRERFAKVLEAHPGLELVKAIQTYYDIDEKSKVEKQRESNQARKALQEAGLIAIEAARASGEAIKTPGGAGEGGDGDGSGDDSATPELTYAQRAIEQIKNIDLDKADKRRTHKLDADRRKELAEMLAELNKMSSKLQVKLEEEEETK